ncbi:hypothetical protein P154DRAFT_524747 [Amniculicola lignicola CBS 123094]|uniref:Uncharacterized protein n=1 Tax=Amniculicola lignicola CBS 123094 TaxID=1392246 RepID=A0A6A5WBM0_9PLEO|nr:hypothetical protein P154DRAFT_524747 [Amniculicola lignicola CBS 123094]
MNDHNIYTTTLDSHELSTKLDHIKRESNNGALFYGSRGHSRQSRTPSFSSDNTTLPSFSKTSTMSTTGSDESNGRNQVSRLQVLRAIPMSGTSRENAEVPAGHFSKGRINRRRGESESAKGKEKEFQYYGRHGNQWLFNDFSVTDSIKKGWGKVFTGNSKTDEEE